MNTLREYINSLSISPEQRSDEWYSLRKNTIGGSEIASILGINPYNSIAGLLSEKIGLFRFYGNTATRWGTLFENITKMYTEQLLCMEEQIMETGSVEGAIPRQRYSPDGLGVVELLNVDGEVDTYIILFEFKAPYRTFPNGRIPPNYLPQVQTGLLSIPIAEYAIFVNNSYRKCPLKELDFTPSYDSIYHATDFKKRRKGAGDSVFACGVIYLYQTETHKNDFLTDISETDIEEILYDDIDREIFLRSDIDFGTVSKDLFDRMLEHLSNKKIFAEYYSPILNHKICNKIPFIKMHNLQRNETGNLQEFISACSVDAYNKHANIIGVLPWKLLSSDVLLVEKDPNWLNKIKEPVENVLAMLDEIHSSENPEKKYNELMGFEETETESYDEMLLYV